MNLTIYGHEDRYAVEQLLMSLFSQEDITVTSRLSRGKQWLTATTQIELNGKKTRCARRLKAEKETVRLRRQILQPRFEVYAASNRPLRQYAPDYIIRPSRA